MTRTEAIFEMIKGLPEIELQELVEMIHEHSCKQSIEHIFSGLYDFEGDADYQDMLDRLNTYSLHLDLIGQEVKHWRNHEPKDPAFSELTLANIEEIL